jgi:hypothetical protein
MTVTRPLAQYFSRNGKQHSGDRKDSTFTSCLPPTNYATLTLRRSRVRGVWRDAGPALPTEIVLGVHDAAALRAVDRTALSVIVDLRQGYGVFGSGAKCCHQIISVVITTTARLLSARFS